MKDSKPDLTAVTAMIPVPCSSLDRNDTGRRAYEIMKNVEDYPLYMPSVNAIAVLDRKESEMTTRWDAEIDGAPICWVQHIRMRNDTREILFEAIEGDFDVFQGRWRVGESEGRISLVLSIEYKLGIPIIEEVLGPILREKIAANSEMMLKAIAGRLTGQQPTAGKKGWE
ncbi:MAG: SRPBCC family protein [Desulfobacterales bacterium]|nr:SRPBCC family protein [Desulfobacterales bacterium]